MKAAKLYTLAVLLMLIALASCNSGTNPVVNDICATPVATPLGGTYSSTQSVTLTCTSSGATIYYSTDGITYFTYTVPISISTTTTLRAYAVKEGLTDSSTLTASYIITTVNQVATPIATPPGGTYDTLLKVKLTTTTPVASILYTLDGTDPETSSTCMLYSSPISITTTTTIKAYAARTNFSESSILTATYNIILSEETCTSISEAAAKLAASPDGANADNPVKLAMAIDLGDMPQAGSGWQALLQAIETAGKYVELDLSACLINGTKFDPDNTIATGKDKIASLVLPDAVASTPSSFFWEDSAFLSFDALASVSGTNIINIGGRAFYHCASLYSVSFPAAETIGEDAFNGCTSLSEVSFPAVEIIGGGAFSGCTNLSELSFPVVKTIGNSAFYGCTNLGEVNFPAAKTISYGAFFGCKKLSEANFLAAISIGDSAFASCTNLTELCFPASASLGRRPFSGCTQLVFSLYGAGSLSTAEGGKALVQNNTELVAYPSAKGAINLPYTSISERTFADCSNLTEVNFPAAETIGDWAFYGCTSLYSVSLPTAKTIGEDAFYGCTSLYSVSLPTAKTIGEDAFYGCTSLYSVSFPTVKTIGRGVFASCTSLSGASFPAAVTISDYAFSNTGNTALTITMGTSAPTLGYRMFYYDNSKTVTIKIPMGATGYSPASSSFDGTPVTISGANTDVNWANGFRGGGWDGTTWVYGETYDGICGGPSSIIQYITLNIVQE